MSESARKSSRGRGFGRGRGGLFAKRRKSDTNQKSAEKKRMTAAELRTQADIANLDDSLARNITFPDPNNQMEFEFSFVPEESFWKGYQYRFKTYPHDGPKVRCKDKIYHPNIDFDGAVCINILRKDWRPIFDLNSVLFGIILLMHEPNPSDPLNLEAAKVLRENEKKFARNVMKSLRGGYVDEEYFPAATRG
eukprot:maker-scaffold_6-snap-gene-10.2-mRNA-1 protein AED:0.22 eAED:0.22 QI:389/0.5/0.33/1/1/1/3/0/192